MKLCQRNYRKENKLPTQLGPKKKHNCGKEQNPEWNFSMEIQKARNNTSDFKRFW